MAGLQRTIERKLAAMPTSDGAGVRLKRGIGTPALDHLDLLSPRAWPLVGVLFGGLLPVLSVLAASIVFVSACHLVYLAIERRQKLYGELDETRARFNQML